MVGAQKQQLGAILNVLGEELDITPTQYEDARGKYNAVGDWLAKTDTELTGYNPKIYPQGSIRLGTVVKPLSEDEFDVDLVCELQIASNSNQEAVKNMVGRRLSQNETYEQILVPKNRCWRLNYAGRFHMDILPAIPDSSKGNGCLFVPDRKLEEWKPSNPEGYAIWFESKMITIRKALLEKLSEVQNIPDNNSIRTPLQRSVQLLKRHRDIIFQTDKDSAPLSIIITTLAAKAYANEDDLFSAITNIIGKMPSCIDVVKNVPCVLNPTNTDENFAEKWREYPIRYDKFIGWLTNLQVVLCRVVEQRDLKKIGDGLSLLFGKELVGRGLVKYAEATKKEQEKGKLKMAGGTGLLGSTGTTVPKNTFYGE